jgi:hypothetical protein
MYPHRKAAPDFGAAIWPRHTVTSALAAVEGQFQTVILELRLCEAMQLSLIPKALFRFLRCLLDALKNKTVSNIFYNKEI